VTILDRYWGMARLPGPGRRQDQLWFSNFIASIKVGDFNRGWALSPDLALTDDTSGTLTAFPLQTGAAHGPAFFEISTFQPLLSPFSCRGGRHRRRWQI